MPEHGYTAMFEPMLDHPLIEVRTGVDFRDVRDEVEARSHDLHRADRRIFRLPLRQAAVPQPAVRHQTLDQEWFQPVGDGQLSRPRTCPTRAISEYKHLTGQEHAADDDHLRISGGRGRSLLPDSAGRKPGAVQDATKRWPTRPTDVTFVGRLATYRYYNMDQIVGQALATFRRIDAKRKEGALSGVAVAAE